MDQPDASTTTSPSAPILVRRRTRRLQTPPPSTLVHGRIAGSLAFTNHRVSTDDPSTAPNLLNIRTRQVRRGKRELRCTDSTVHPVHILHHRRTLGRILR